MKNQIITGIGCFARPEKLGRIFSNPKGSKPEIIDLYENRELPAGETFGCFGSVHQGEAKTIKLKSQNKKIPRRFPARYIFSMAFTLYAMLGPQF